MMNQDEEYEAEVEMELTSVMEKKMVELFDIEIEILQGSREKLPDGRHLLKFKVKGAKADLIKNFVLRIISKSDKLCLN